MSKQQALQVCQLAIDTTDRTRRRFARAIQGRRYDTKADELYDKAYAEWEKVKHEQKNDDHQSIVTCQSLTKEATTNWADYQAKHNVPEAVVRESDRLFDNDPSRNVSKKVKSSKKMLLVFLLILAVIAIFGLVWYFK